MRNSNLLHIGKLCTAGFALLLAFTSNLFGATATSASADTATHGNWKGVYGADGYGIPFQGGTYPTYASVAFSGASQWVWNYGTSDAAALQKPSGSDRIASCWYAAKSYSIDINLTDGKSHRVALYFLDWDAMGRQQTVTVTDAASGAVLNSQSLSGFSKGTWLAWDLAGRVKVTITATSGNAVAGGLFFGGMTSTTAPTPTPTPEPEPEPAPAPTAGTAATFVKLDTATQGNWKGNYGGDGLNIPSVGGTFPAYANVSFSGSSTWVWNYDSTDIAAVQKISASDRVATCWYAPSTFSINVNLTDGQTHRMAIYCLDWDGAGRQQTVTITDTASGATLNSQTVTDFSRGVWLVWDVKGKVTATFRALKGNTVANGLFFGPGAANVAPVPQVATPLINPPAGSFSGAITVSISTATAGATIRYTLDGSTPTSSSAIYSGPFSRSTTVTVKAKAFKTAMTDSAVASATLTINNPTAPSSNLPDLANLPNRVFPAPEGFDTVQFAPDGKLGFIVWRDQQLIYRERGTTGSWTEDVVSNGGNVFKMLTGFTYSGLREDYRFQPAAILLYDTASNAHVFQASGRNIAHYMRGSGGWLLMETIPAALASDNIAGLVGAVGPNNVFHLAVLGAGLSRNLTYASNRTGQWSWSAIANVSEAPLSYWAPPYAPRWLSLAVDSRNVAHVAFRTAMTMSYDNASHPRAYSELKYAHNASGYWAASLVQKPDDISAEAANGMSIAIGPDDKPRIASWYNDRGEGGSSSNSRLFYHEPNGSGGWTRTVVLSSPDGYVAGDGPKGSGFSPYLRFDPSGRPHILFLDHAGEHFYNIGQQEYAGNLRHAVRNGSTWTFDTIYRQSAPLAGEIVFPAFALRGNEMAVTLLQRNTQWNFSSYPPISNSTYYFRFFTKSVQ